MPYKDPEQSRLNKKAYYEANKEKLKARVAEYAKNNPEKVAAYAKAYAQKNPDKVNAAKKKYAVKPEAKLLAREKARRWREANPERALEVSRAHEAKRPKRVTTKEQRATLNMARLQQRRSDPALRAKEAAYRREKKAVYNALGAKRRALKRNACTAWDRELTNFVAVEAFDLAKTREQLTAFGWEVDHFYPISGRTVCGLHTWANLRVIPAYTNRQKLNKIYPESEFFNFSPQPMAA